MGSKRFSWIGVCLIIGVIVAAIVIGRLINPFETAVPRTLFAALLGGVGGAMGAGLATKLGLTKSGH